MEIGWGGASCPTKADEEVDVPVTVRTSELVPKIIAETTTTVIAMTPEGETLFCLEIETIGGPHKTPTPADITTTPIMMSVAV